MRKLPIVSGKLVNIFFEIDKRSSLTSCPTWQAKHEGYRYEQERKIRNDSIEDIKNILLIDKKITFIRQWSNLISIKSHDFQRLKFPQIHRKSLDNIISQYLKRKWHSNCTKDFSFAVINKIETSFAIRTTAIKWVNNNSMHENNQKQQSNARYPQQALLAWW